MELSISIVSYNTRETLRECLSSIIRNVKDIEYEIIVVDNGSWDGSAEMVKQKFLGVSLIENYKNLFFTRANNQSIRRSRGRYILLLNSDVLILDNTIKDMLELMEENLEVGAVSGCILFPDGRIQNTGWNFHTPIDEILSQEPLRRLFKRNYQLPITNCQLPKEVDVVSDAFMLVRRRAIFQIGLYDERFLLYYTEDDLCHRLKGAGWKVYHFPSSRVVHKLFGSSTKLSVARIALIRLTDTLKYCGKYYKLPNSIIISFFLCAGFLIEILKLLMRKAAK